VTIPINNLCLLSAVSKIKIGLTCW